MPIVADVAYKICEGHYSLGVIYMLVPFNKQKNAGFSLVELMIVVAIIGVLAALAVPKFKTFQAKARQAEVKTNLTHIYTLEEAYYGDNEAYIAMPSTGFVSRAAVNCNANALGFLPQPCQRLKVRYTYAAAIQNGGTEFTASGTSGSGANNLVFPGCGTQDVWGIDETKLLTNTTPAIASCK